MRWIAIKSEPSTPQFSLIVSGLGCAKSNSNMHRPRHGFVIGNPQIVKLKNEKKTKRDFTISFHKLLRKHYQHACMKYQAVYTGSLLKCVGMLWTCNTLGNTHDSFSHEWNEWQYSSIDNLPEFGTEGKLVRGPLCDRSLASKKLSRRFDWVTKKKNKYYQTTRERTKREQRR